MNPAHAIQWEVIKRAAYGYVVAHMANGEYLYPDRYGEVKRAALLESIPFNNSYSYQHIGHAERALRNHWFTLKPAPLAVEGKEGRP